MPAASPRPFCCTAITPCRRAISPSGPCCAAPYWRRIDGADYGYESRLVTWAGPFDRNIHPSFVGGRAVFASPEPVGAASAYVSAGLSLLADAHESPARRDQSYESTIAGLRRTIGADRYGLASQVLSVRDGCTADACDAFGLVYDDKKLRANMKDRLFDVTVARYAVNWPTRTRPLASGGSNTPTGMPAGPNVTFPSAASIPPVSIMNSEPPQAAAPATSPPGQSSGPAPESRPTNTAPASAARRPPAKKSSDGAAPLSLNPNAKQ